MEKFAEKKVTRFIKFAEARSTLKKAKNEENNIQEQLEMEVKSCELTYDSVSTILVRLPFDALLRSLSVCKSWYDMIHNPVFIHDHLLRSELVILFQACALKKNVTDDDFSVESSVVELTNLAKSPILHNSLVRFASRYSIQFMDYVDGKAVTRNYNISCLGRVVGSCNGLILIKYHLARLIKNIGMVVINPVTRKSIFLRLGTISIFNKESYGFGYDPSTKQYKVVHLFDDGSGYTNCEIIVVGAKHWKMVDGPTFGFTWFEYRPVSAIGALHWLPQKLHNDHIVSLEITKERFKTIELPTSGGLYDRIAELGDKLCFTSHEEIFKIGIWVLKSLSDETWTRFHTVRSGYIMDMVPISGSRSGGQIVFTRDEDGSIHVYDFGFKAMFTLKMGNDESFLRDFYYLPHVNSLVSWSL